MQTKKRKNSEKQKIRGFLFALFGGILWGFSGTCGQYLFTFEDLDSEWLTVTRMLFSGIILLGVSAISHREEMTAVWKNKKDAIRLVLFAIFGTYQLSIYVFDRNCLFECGNGYCIAVFRSGFDYDYLLRDGKEASLEKRTGCNLACDYRNISACNTWKSRNTCNFERGIILGTEFRSRTGTLYNAARKFN